MPAPIQSSAQTKSPPDSSASPRSGPRATAKYFEDLAVGMSAQISRRITQADIDKFAELSGDHNPLHLDPAFAATTIFKGPIAHGMLSACLIGTVFAEELPGSGAIYVEQNLKFKAPVRPGETVIARVEITGLVPAKKFAVFKTQCLVGDKVVIDGTATLLVAARPTLVASRS